MMGWFDILFNNRDCNDDELKKINRIQINICNIMFPYQIINKGFSRY